MNILLSVTSSKAIPDVLVFAKSLHIPYKAMKCAVKTEMYTGTLPRIFAIMKESSTGA
jgi:hypothetical protein